MEDLLIEKPIYSLNNQTWLDQNIYEAAAIDIAKLIMSRYSSETRIVIVACEGGSAYTEKYTRYILQTNNYVNVRLVLIERKPEMYNLTQGQYQSYEDDLLIRPCDIVVATCVWPYPTNDSNTFLHFVRKHAPHFVFVVTGADRSNDGKLRFDAHIDDCSVGTPLMHKICIFHGKKEDRKHLYLRSFSYLEDPLRERAPKMFKSERELEYIIFTLERVFSKEYAERVGDAEAILRRTFSYK